MFANGQPYYRETLLELKDFEIFELIKSVVETKFGMHRAGLSLILQGLPSDLGAYHVVGSNMIIINKRILDIIRIHKSREEYNSYYLWCLVMSIFTALVL
jgi:hypothetical protein